MQAAPKGPEHDPTWGDCWTYVALDPISKLVVNVTIGNRDQQTTNVFLEGLRLATSGRFQPTTDGFAPYRTGVLNTLEDRASRILAHLGHRFDMIER